MPKSKKNKNPLRKNASIKGRVKALEKSLRYIKEGPRLNGGKPVRLCDADRLTEQIFKPPIKD